MGSITHTALNCLSWVTEWELRRRRRRGGRTHNSTHTFISKFCKDPIWTFSSTPSDSIPLLIYTWFLKNQFGKIKFDELDLLVYFELDFYCQCSLQKSILKLIFESQKSSLSNLIFTTWFFQKSSKDQQGVWQNENQLRAEWLYFWGRVIYGI